MNLHRSLLLVAASLVAALPSLAQAPTDEGGAVNRLAQIADKLYDAGQGSEAVPLLTEAVGLCGIAIWGEDRHVIKPPVSQTIGLAVTDYEVRAYSDMFVNGHSVRLGDLTDAIDHLLPNTSIQAPLLAALNNERPYSTKTEPFLTFIRELHGKVHENSLLFTADTELDAIQALLIMRGVGEEIRVAAKKGAGATGQSSSNSKAKQGTLMPGWAEDATVGTFLTGLEKLAGIQDPYTNAVASICKFVATYSFLKGEGSIEAPGGPLPRRLDTQPGERRRLAMKFFIDGTKATDWLKENRLLLLSTGIDLDMPHSGPLAGIETDWDIRENKRNITQNLIQLPRGAGVDLTKVKTDAQGVARVDVEGRPRAKALDANKAKPIMKKVMIYVTPQVKATEMQQDLVDAVLGAIGIESGGVGLITPVMETLYRMKWKGRTPLPLDVKDWQAADQFLTMSMTVKGDYSYFTNTGFVRQSIDRKIDITGLELSGTGAIALPEFDAAMLAALPPAQRELIRSQMEAARREMEEAAKTRIYNAVGSGQLLWHFNDRNVSDLDTSDCEQDRMKIVESWTGGGQIDLTANFMEEGNGSIVLAADTTTKKIELSPSFVFDVLYQFERKALRTPAVKGQAQNSLGIMTNINLLDGMRTPTLDYREEKELPGEGDGTYLRASGTIPFESGKVKGNIIIALIIYSKPMR
ncbi:MAG: hypothetical protein KF812_01580 [Fimbriimonadaceae bacterium]|nr:hypothetical protein [Fimbriimonadaceae bacterium]